MGAQPKRLRQLQQQISPRKRIQSAKKLTHVALEAIANGGSAKKAARDWGVLRATLYNRMHGHECRKDAFSALQRLSQTQEKQLTEWILIQDALGLPPTHSQIRQFAQRMLAVKGDHTPLGKHWMQAFLRRNPAVRTQKCHHRDSARVNGASTEVIRPWFNNFFLPEILAIKPENRYNMDEAGIMEGLGENGLVVGMRVRCRHLPPPPVIFKGKSVQQQWFPEDLSTFSDWQFTATKNGWTSDQTAVETQPPDPSERRLLVLDGHGSHETVDFMYLCYQHQIHLLSYLPYLSCAATARFHYYRKQVGFLSLLTDSSPVGKQNFLSCYQKAREQALTVSNIKGGWKATATFEPSSAGEQQQTQKNAKIHLPTSDWQSDTSQIAWSTPRRSQDLKVQVVQFNQLDDDVPTKRLLFRKITKGFDEKDGLLAKAQLQIQALETQLAAVKPKKRKRVVTSPNSRFANIEAIRRAQEEVNAAENEESDETEAEVSEIEGIELMVLKMVVIFWGAQNRGVPISMCRDLTLSLRDITQAYPQSQTKLSRTILTYLPTELQGKYPNGTIIRVIKPLYGIAEAGVHWFRTYQQHHLEKLDMSTSTYDSCLLISNTGPDTLGIVGMQTDDTLILGTNNFSTREEEELQRQNFVPSPRLTSHTEQRSKMTTIDPKAIDRHQRYVEERARASYIASIAQPEASFDVSVAAQRLQWQMDHQLRGLTYKPIDLATAKLMVFTDGSFANNKDLSSQLGFVIALVNETNHKEKQFEISGNIVHWSSTNVLASEIYGMANGFDIGISLAMTMKIITERLNLPPILSSQARYDEGKRLMIDIMALRQSYEKREITDIRWINGADNPADAMTKASPNRALERFIDTNSLTIRVEGYEDPSLLPRYLQLRTRRRTHFFAIMTHALTAHSFTALTLLSFRPVQAKEELPGSVPPFSTLASASLDREQDEYNITGAYPQYHYYHTRRRLQSKKQRRVAAKLPLNGLAASIWKK
ncbi:Tc5 transposase DNA-binding domain-containing protein [Hirsutella rhossiliensis]